MKFVVRRPPRHRRRLNWIPSKSSVGGPLLAGTPVVTFTAPATTLAISAITLVAGTPTVTFTAPTATRVVGAVTLAAGVPTVIFSAPAATVAGAGGGGGAGGRVSAWTSWSARDDVRPQSGRQ